MAQLANVMFRSAEPKDALAVAPLHAESWRQNYRGAYSDAFLDGDVEADRLEVWTDRLGGFDGRTATILADDGGALVGFVHVVFDHDPKWGSLVDNLHVSSAFKRGGIGTQLMATAAAAVLDRETGGLYLWVLEQNTAAQAFYSSRGGSCTGRRLVVAPGGIPDRLAGAPIGLRYAWSDPTTLIA